MWPPELFRQHLRCGKSVHVAVCFHEFGVCTNPDQFVLLILFDHLQRIMFLVIFVALLLSFVSHCTAIHLETVRPCDPKNS